METPMGSVRPDDPLYIRRPEIVNEIIQKICIEKSYDKIASLLQDLDIKYEEYETDGDKFIAAVAYSLEHLSDTDSADNPAQLIEEQIRKFDKSFRKGEQQRIEERVHELADDLRGIPRGGRRRRRHPRFWADWRKRLKKLTRTLKL